MFYFLRDTLRRKMTSQKLENIFNTVSVSMFIGVWLMAYRENYNHRKLLKKK